MDKRHILKTEGLGIFKSYCGLYSYDSNEFLRRAVKGDICKNCIRCRIAYKRKVRS